MMTFGKGVKLKHVTLLLIAYATTGLVAAQEPLEVPTGLHDGHEFVVSDLHVERRLVGDAFNISIADLKLAFKDLQAILSPFLTGDSDEVLTKKIPFVGKSLNKLVTGASAGSGIDAVLNLASLLNVNNFPNGDEYNLTDVQDIMITSFEDYVDSFIPGSSVVGTAPCPADSPIVLYGNLSESAVTVTVCAELTFTSIVELDASGLFDVLDGFAEIDLELMLDVTATVAFGANFTYTLDDVENHGAINLSPVVVSLGAEAFATLNLTVGMLDLASNASVSVNGEFELTFCNNFTSTCEDIGEVFGNFSDGNSSFYLDRNVGYIIAGDFAASTGLDPIPGLTLPSFGAGFLIDEASVFNPAPNITFPGMDDIDLLSFIDFSPQNGIGLLKKIDSALARAEENEAFDINIPFSKVSLSKILATGSVVTSKLLELFVRPETFEDRESKSLELTATKKVLESGGTVPSDGKRLDFYFLAQELPADTDILLNANPDNQKGVRNITSINVCEMTLSTNYTADLPFATALITGINDATCGIVACAYDSTDTADCVTDEDTRNFRCATTDCDVLIGLNDDGFVFMASVADRGGYELDVQLFGLYEPLATTNGPGSIFGFPLNQPTFPNLVPRFRDLKDFANRINLAIVSRFTGVTIGLLYVAEDTNTNTAARFEISIDFAVSGTVTADFDGSVGVGDLIDISTVGNATLEVTVAFNVSTVLAVIFEANDVEQLVLIGNACGNSTNATFSCDLEATTFNLTIDAIEYVLEMSDQSNASASTALGSVLMAVIPAAARPIVKEVGANVLTLSFPNNISAVELATLKNCIPVEDQPADPPQFLSCPDGKSTYEVFNSYGLTDDTISKRPFQVAIGKTSISAEFTIGGDVTLAANVGGVIEVEAGLEATLRGSLTLDLGTGELLRFSEWLAALIAIFNQDSDGHRIGFFNATACFDGTFSATVEALAPFDFIPEIGVEGEFAEPFQIDFLFVNNASLPPRSLPNVTFEVDLPDIGGLRNLSFQDIVKLLGQVLEFLVGAEADQTPTSCSGGLLGLEINNEAVFSYQIPVLGLSACSSARFLQVFVDAVDDLTNGGNATFNSLEVKLKTLLQDGVGGTPDVEILTTYDNVTGIAELLLNITLAWNTTESTTLNVDLSDLLGAPPDDKPDIQRFIKEFVPAAGQAQLDVSGGVTVTLAVGIEYRSNTSETLPFIVGTTGVQVDIGASAEIEFEARIGPLGAEVSANITVEGENNGPLSIRVGLDSGMSYYLIEPDDPGFRPNFEYTGISGLIEELGVEFDGRVEAILIAEVPLVGMRAVINATVASVDALFNGITENNVFAEVIEFTPPSSPIPSFIEILLADPDALVDGLDSVFGQAEAATLGPNGILRNFEAPFVGQKIGKSVGANTKDNVLEKARSAIIPKLKAKLEGFEGPTDTVADILARVIEDVLRERPEDDFLGLIKEGDSVTTTCFVYNNATTSQENHTCSDDSITPTSIMWTIPFGQEFVIELPIDFKLDDDFPIEISLQSEVPTLCIGWGFNLAFGYDETEGFFLYTFPDPGERSEFVIEALLSVPKANISASLFFLDIDLTSTDINVGAQLFVDIDKSSALRKPDVAGPNYGRVTQGDFSKITQISDLFVIGAIAGATILVEKAEVSVDVPVLGVVNQYIPKLNFGVAAHFRKVIDIKPSESVSRRLRHGPYRSLLHDGNRRLVGRLHEGSDHPAWPLLRSLRGLETGTDGSVAGEEFIFGPCPADGINITACAVVTDITLDVEEIALLVSPIVDEFVNEAKTGVLDLIVNPLEPMRAPIPGVKEITGKKVSVLDVAEAFDSLGSGVATVRTLFQIYDDLRDLADQLRDLEGILLAEVCDVLAGFNCTGGLSDTFDSDDRRLVDATYYDPFGSSVDAFDLPMTPRILGTCTTSFTKGECKDLTAQGECGCTGTAKAKCLAKLTACKVGSIEGLSFPLLESPLDALALLSGGDVQLLDFSPPEIVFAFSYEQFIVLYTPPTCTLTIGFEFSIRLRVGFVLDTKGIREAVGPPVDVLKALNSLAFKDLFDGVDEPLIVITATITVELAASAAIIKISATGGITFQVTIDFYDPFPDTSEGLIRPFELLSLGTNPLEWFDISLVITLSLKISIEIGLFLGFLEITLFSYSVEFIIEIVDGVVGEPIITVLIEYDPLLGELLLEADRIQDGVLECFSRSGDVGNEEIECASGKLYRTYSAVKTLCGGICDGNPGRALALATPSKALVVADPVLAEFTDYPPSRALQGGMTVSFDCVQSTIDICGFGSIALMNLIYRDCPSLLSNNQAFISANEVVAGVANTLFDGVAKACIVTPVPEIEFFTTVFEGDCGNQWDIIGHSNINVHASDIQDGCVIEAPGGFTNAVLRIYLESLTSDTICNGDNTVVLGTDGDDKDADSIIATITLAGGNPRVVKVGSVFEDIEIHGSPCNDVIILERTFDVKGSVYINGYDGDDIIKIGGDDTNNGVDSIFKTVYTFGGEGENTLIVNDSTSSLSKTEVVLDGGSLLQILNGLNDTSSDLSYEDFDTITLLLSNTNATVLAVTSTLEGSMTSVYAGDANDVIFVNETQGDILIHGGGGNDTFYFTGLGDNATANIYGDGDDDTLFVDGTAGLVDVAVNTFDNSTVRWSGGPGNDVVNTIFTSNGTSNLDIFDDEDDATGVNAININCSNFACFILSRENFLANIHDPDDEFSSVERINIVREVNASEISGFTTTVRVSRVFLSLNDGDNSMFFDDTMAPMTVYGGPDSDSFRVGQLYNSKRGVGSHVNAADPITTTLTTRGYLSDGNNHPIVLNGEFGGDLFDVLRNKKILDLNGGSGDDTFVVRSFVNLPIAGNGTILPADVAGVRCFGGDDDDAFDVNSRLLENATDVTIEDFDVKEDDPDYLINSLVDVDGGTGTDHLVVVGTEFDDSYVVTERAVYGGGLTIKFVNIEILELSCEEGNDLVSVLSTSPTTQTAMYGSLGSDQFVIAPRDVAPVVSKNLRGHRGILEHVISSEDPDYDMLLIQGVAVDVLDNDGEFGYINIVEFEAVHLLTEDGTGSFTFAVYPTRKPTADTIVVIDILPPADKNTKNFLTFNEESELAAFSLYFTDTVAQYVEVKYNVDGGVAPLEITELFLLITINLSTATTDQRFTATEQSIFPVDVRLIPGIENVKAKSVTVFQPTGRTVVAEGDHGFDATYNVFLRPCTNDMATQTKLTIAQSVAGQLSLSHSEIFGIGEDNWNVDGDCNVTITVHPSDDYLQEGDHFVTLSHLVTNATGGPVLLSNNSTLFASNVLVRIYDKDIGSVIVQETGAATNTAEMEISDQNSLNDAALHEDTYKLRLTKQPIANVSVTVVSQRTATDRETPSTAELQRDYTKRIQAHVGTVEGDNQAATVTIVFTNETWNDWHTIRVTAYNDDVTEGVDLLPFPSQPSYLSFIQGPISVSGAGSASFPNISNPLLLPGENDTVVFAPPNGSLVDRSSFFAIEEKQVDSLRIYNTDVRGNATSNGILTKLQLVGFNMAENIVINGKETVDGIEYSGMEIVEIYLGNGADKVIVEDTTGAIHFLDTGGGDDLVQVKNISGPFIIHGQNGSDVVDVSSDERKLDRIEALLAFDGGTDEKVDTLNADNSGSDEGDILFVSRQMVEFENLMPEDYTNLPDSFLIDLRDATEGSFFLQFNESEGESSNVTVPYPINGSDLESLIQRALIPEDEERFCGLNQTTKCSNAVKVYEIGQTFAVFFVGERLNTGVNVTLDVGNLQSNFEAFSPEVFQDATVNLLKRNSDIAYANLEVLDIKTGTGAALVNVRGTSAKTIITTQDKNDLVFISSEASQVDNETAASLEFLTGWLDYLEKDLTVNVGIGRHRLLISDENSTISKGNDITGPAELTKESLTNISYDLGDIFYTAEGGNWSAGVNLWLGKGDDRLNVVSVPSNPGSATLRTTTMVRAGPGEDTLNIALEEDDHQGTVFVANGEADNDVINASQSTLGVILFGDGGDDRILGGAGRDVVFGDFGRVVWRSFPGGIFAHTGDVVAVAGGDGFGDFTDGIVRIISDVFSVFADLGGSDYLTLGSEDDVGIGGPFNDTIEGDDGRDILFGDSADIRFYKESTFPKSLLSINCTLGGSDTLYGGPGVVDYLVGGSEGDEIYGNEGMDLAFGDHAYIELFEETSHKLSFAETINASCAGGVDTISLGAGDDLAFGGAMGDIIYGDEGQDVIFGDFGLYNASEVFLPFQNYRPIIDFPQYAGNDTIHGGADDDFIIGEEGNDTIYGDSGSDDIYGGHSIRHGLDVGDSLHGGSEDDMILGDNGKIVRNRISFTGANPWINGMVWETWPAPFNTEVIRDVRRYDDIDFVEGNDFIYGDDGNDILHGQRGDDYISGGRGEDEIYGELGSDTLDGDSGNDIVLGDIGYIVRRVDSQGEPILISKTDTTDSAYVWKKDIVLEELGNIEGIHRISQKINTAELLAEDVTSASLLFVANAFDEDGNKHFDDTNVIWLTDLLLFKLNSEPDDDIIDGGEGDDVCIGQRGDDTLHGGPGNDLLIGDAGTNVIAQNMDMPRIYQIYRTLSVPDGSGYDVSASDFGATFSADYELYPLQYRSVDYLASIIDLVINVDDLQEKSNLLNDIIGVSALSTEEHCMQPMFRITPGFLYETQQIHGNDKLLSGPGDSILIGDDIRGFTALDLTTELSSALLRQQLDNLIIDLSVRMSTLEVDTEFFLKGSGADSNNAGFNITVARDNITTDKVGRHFVIGDSLTMIARSVRGGSFHEENAAGTVEDIIERLHDIEQVFMQVHIAMYEVHHDLLGRAIGVDPESKSSQHALSLANDYIDSRGDGDFVFGDSSVLFFQADRPGTEGFDFLTLTTVDSQSVRGIAKAREGELDDYVDNTLTPSNPLGNKELGGLLFDDVPFLLTVGCDTILLNAAANLGVGDFGLLGLTSSGQPIVQANALADYAESIEILRTHPSASSINFQLRLPYVAKQQMSFYYERYGSTVRAEVVAKRRADDFVAKSSSCTILGEFFTGFAYGQDGLLGDTFLLDTKSSGFNPACLPNPNGRRLPVHEDELRSRRGRDGRSLQFSDGGRCIATFDGDTFDIVNGTVVDGQRGKDEFVVDGVASNAVKVSNNELKDRLLSLTREFFINHELIVQMNKDIFKAPIKPTTLTGLKTGYQCTDPVESTYIPPIA